MQPRGKKITLLAGAVLLIALGSAAYVYRAHLRFWWLFERLGDNAQGYPEYRHRQTDIIFVKLPGGTFWMGAQAEDPEGRNYDPDAEEYEGPVHEVTLSPFLIAKYEVTQAQWMAVMGSNPSWFQPTNAGAPALASVAEATPIPAGVDTGDWPVDNLSWTDCRRFCGKTGLSLPTEAQWEYSCRAGAENLSPGTDNLDDMAWYRVSSGLKTHPADMKRANAFGIHDMLGDVMEWCDDFFDVEFYSKQKATRRDPLCATDTFGTALRGGCWASRSLSCRSAEREDGDPSLAFGFFGSRAAYSFPD